MIIIIIRYLSGMVLRVRRGDISGLDINVKDEISTVAPDFFVDVSDALLCDVMYRVSSHLIVMKSHP